MPDVPPKQPVTGVDSVRMDPPSGLPPVGDSAAQAAEPFRPQADPLPSAGIVALHGSASQISPEAFPVLKAFQDYLESERQRASKRVALLSCVFAAVIIFLLGAFALIYLKGQDRQERAQERQDSLIQTLISQSMQQQNQPVPPAAAPQQTSIQEITSLISDAIAKDRQSQNAQFEKTLSAYTSAIEAAKAETAALKSELEKAKQTPQPAPVQATTAPAPVTQVRSADVPAAQPQAASQAKPAAQPAQVTKTAPAPAAQPATAIPAAPVTQPAPAAPQPPKLEIPKYPAPPPPEGFTPGSMTIKTGKDAKPVSWRVYVPER